MSLPFKIIKCDTCDYEANSICLWGIFDYVAPDGTRLNVNRTYGWCYTCQDIRPVEVLPDQYLIENDIDMSIQELADIQETGLFGYVLRLIGKDRQGISILKDRIQTQRRQLEFLYQRKSPPKCLTCSGIEFKIVELPNPHGANVMKIAELSHPGCGGNLLVKNSEWWLNIASTTKEYDFEGNYIREVRC